MLVVAVAVVLVERELAVEVEVEVSAAAAAAAAIKVSDDPRNTKFVDRRTGAFGRCCCSRNIRFCRCCSSCRFLASTAS